MARADESEDGLSCAGGSYRWSERSGSSRRGVAREWAHSGIAQTADGRLLVGDASGHDLLFLDSGLNLIGAVGTPAVELHGLTLEPTAEGEVLWVADIGRKRRPALDYDYELSAGGGRVLRLSLEGELLDAFGPPELPVYAEVAFAPTSVALDERASGGSGAAWVADGYGAELVHQLDAGGSYLRFLDGREGAGRFACPHAVFIDRRRPEPELCVADRANHRLQVYDLEGRFKRAYGEEFLLAPSGLCRWNDYLLVADLTACAVVFIDLDDRCVGRLAADPEASSRPGWPNARHDAAIVPPALRRGRLNSPHALTVDERGTIVVSEWLIGGRIAALTRS